MRLFHISDLHLGKRIHEFSMIEEQVYILDKILEKIRVDKPDALLISGDIYDKPIPPVEAIELLNDFLTKLAQMELSVYLIAGNHDSAQRLDFAHSLLEENKVYISGVYRTTPKQVVQTDAFGEVVFTLMPFIKPAMVSSAFGLDKTLSYEEGMQYAIAQLHLDTDKRNILLAHQFVTWKGTAERSDSETYHIGGVDEIDASVFDGFDYVALGHLHAPQRIGRDSIRYSGSPLAYSFSEIHQKKGITIVELGEKGKLQLDFFPLAPRRKMREIKGPLKGLVEAGKEEGGSLDYIRAIITDEALTIDPVGQLRTVYPNLMTLEFERKNTTTSEGVENIAKDFVPQDMFDVFFEKQTQKKMDEEQNQLIHAIWKKLGGEEA